VTVVAGVHPFVLLLCCKQVVDGNWGMGVSIPKYVFEGSKKRYSPKVICGSSTPVAAAAGSTAPAASG
jgi:hypothetical protein